MINHIFFITHIVFHKHKHTKYIIGLQSSMIILQIHGRKLEGICWCLTAQKYIQMISQPLKLCEMFIKSKHLVNFLAATATLWAAQKEITWVTLNYQTSKS